MMMAGSVLYLIGMALPMLLWGSLAQRIGRKPVLLAALVIYGVANLALPSGSTLEAFLLLRLMQGVGASGISVMARVLIRDSFRGDLLAKLMITLPEDSAELTKLAEQQRRLINQFRV